MRNIKLFFFWFLSAHSAVSLASTDEERSFYALHQAVGYFESFLQNHCSTGKMRATVEIKGITTQKVSPEMQSKFSEFTTLLGSQGTSASEVESFRFSLHQYGSQKLYPHSTAWHVEIKENCGR